MLDELFEPDPQKAPAPLQATSDLPPILEDIFIQRQKDFHDRMAEKHGGQWITAWEKSLWNPKNRK